MPVELNGNDEIIVNNGTGNHENTSGAAKTNQGKRPMRSPSRSHLLNISSPNSATNSLSPSNANKNINITANGTTSPLSHMNRIVSPKEKKLRRKSSLPRLFKPYTDTETVSNHHLPNLEPILPIEVSPLPTITVSRITLKDKAQHHINKIRTRINDAMKNISLNNIPKWRKISILHWFLLVFFIILLISHFIEIFILSSTPGLTMKNNIITNFIIWGISDNIAQIIEIALINKKLHNDIDTFTFQPFKKKNTLKMTTPATAATVPAQDTYQDYTVEENGLYAFDLENDVSVPSLTISLDQYTGETNFKTYRWVCFIIWGSIIGIPQYIWYKFLNFLFTTDPILVNIIEKILCDQLVYSPILLYAFFNYSNYIIENGDSRSLMQKISNLYLQTIAINYMIWPVSQLINFSLVNKDYQPIFSSVISLFWNSFLSFRNSQN